ncbi:MAG: cupin domain-containing protein [Candidatus Izemoplasmatales bacterium]|jgi:quercetin dioxygenase-like cupin family protein|nr:cupin domain-containing protein [Candidatus Izemoplasmatales bacterium]
MIVGNVENLVAKDIISDEVKDANIRVLVGPENGWNDYVMRVLEVKAGGYTPKHSHPWPHINYIIAGEGSLMIDGKENPVKAGSYAYVPQDHIHQFRNVGKETFKFICIVPKEGHK